MTIHLKQLEICIGEVNPIDEHCKEYCLEQPRDEMRKHYCYVPCMINREEVKMPLPETDEELEQEFMANYTYVMGVTGLHPEPSKSKVFEVRR